MKQEPQRTEEDIFVERICELVALGTFNGSKEMYPEYSKKISRKVTPILKKSLHSYTAQREQAVREEERRRIENELIRAPKHLTTQRKTNMTNQEKTQAVLEAVRNTKGLEHLKELSFGCEVKDPFCKEIVTLVSIHSEDRLNAVYTMRKCDDGNEYLHTAENLNTPDVEKYKIIGHPVQWSDVLVAMNKHAFDKSPMLSVEGQLIDYNPETGSLITTGKWVDLLKTPEQNLLADPELTDFLYELLVK